LHHNTTRPHQGWDMDNMTPKQKLKWLLQQIQPQIAAFPLLLLGPISSALLIPTLAPKPVQYFQASYQRLIV